MVRELQLPVGVREPLRHVARQLGQSAVSFLADGNPEGLVGARAQLSRINGICRLLGARRAALFCTELEALLCECNRDESEKIAVRGRAAEAILKFQQFVTDIALPILDEQFDVQCINALRKARGKRALPNDSARTRVLTSCSQFPLPDIPQRVLEKLGTLQSALRDDEEGRETNMLGVRNDHLAELASLLEVCGLPLEMRRLPTALAQLELHFRYLSTCGQVCTADRLARTDLFPAGEYFLLEGRKSLVSIFILKIEGLLNSLADIAQMNSGRNPLLQLRDAVLKFTCITEALAMLSRCGILTALNSFQRDIVTHGAALCRHVNSNASGRFAPNGSVRDANLLLLRVSLSLQKMLTLHNSADRYAENLTRRICRDCAGFLSRRRRELRDNMLGIHGVDCELIICANSELERCRLALISTLDDIETSKGFCYVSETLCTSVYKVSQILLVMGQIALHEVVEELRECLTRGLEQQQETGSDLRDALRALCERMQRPLPEIRHNEWCTDDERMQLAQCVSRCVVQMKWSLGRQDSAIAVGLHKGHDPQSRTPVAIEQLPVHLASNIHDLLFCAEEIALCDENLDDFEGVNRRLMVELRMLAAGAQALHVHRVARLSAVLAEVHQAIAGLRARRPKVAAEGNELPLPLLVTAHRQLRSGLNQAAARQEVSSNRETIAELYQWLEDFPQQPTMHMMPEGFTIFHREAEEIMSGIEDGVARIAEGSDASALLNLFHTLKGNARVFGADAIATLCHRCEQTLMSSVQECCLPAAVAESGSGVSYVSRDEDAGGQDRRKLATLAHELRLAIDELAPVAETAQQVATIPLSQPHENGVVIPAIALRRMEELALTARTGSGAMSDVLETCRQSADSARLALLGELLAEQERCMEQLCEEIAGSTRISFTRLGPRLQRLVGRHANVLDKQLRLRIVNDGLYADRALVESLVAPLEHLLRNAIDHGIEPVLERRARGKPDNGTITLALEENEDSLVISMTDDGAGIDVDALPKHAIRLGIHVDQQPGEKDRLQWLFLPGFSSREQATEDAGHGIGLAQVASTVAGLGGHVEVASTPGQGCCFRIVLPR